MQHIHINISRYPGLALRAHAHDLGSLTCGIAIGLLLGVGTAINHAHSFNERITERQAGSQAITKNIGQGDTSEHRSTPSLQNEAFPAFIRASQPVTRVPNWGAMSTPSEWGRTYSQLSDTDFVPIPDYDLKTLTIPLKSLSSDDVVHPADIPTVTAKLFYSTRYMAKYDLDADEHSGNHPGVDLKLALGTPIGAVGGGRVYAVSSDARLGLHVIVEHRNERGLFYSIYGHLDSSKVSVGETVQPGQTLGDVGLTGMTTMPHLHLEVHRGSDPAEEGLHAAAFGRASAINPMTFIERNGEM